MTTTQQRLVSTVVKVAAGLLAALLAWGAGRYDASKLDTTRFVADSARREQRYSNDHEILIRIDRRLTDMYCGRLPADQRAGCG